MKTHGFKSEVITIKIFNAISLTHSYFLFSGLTDDLPFDSLYTVTVHQMKMMDFNFMGFSRSIIVRHNNTSTWRMEMLGESNKYAVTNSTEPPFGTQKYVLSEDLGGGKIILNINACDDEHEFNCEDGSCIPIVRRCNSKFDCADRSDEDACHMIDIPTSYLKHVPDQDQTRVVLHVDIASLLDISEVSELIKIKYQLTLTWQDKRLMYLNLKNESSLNMVSHEEASHIWYPVIEC